MALSSCGFSSYSGYPSVSMTTCSGIQDLPLFLFAPQIGIHKKSMMLFSSSFFLMFKISLYYPTLCILMLNLDLHYIIMNGLLQMFYCLRTFNFSIVGCEQDLTILHPKVQIQAEFTRSEDYLATNILSTTEFWSPPIRTGTR